MVVTNDATQDVAATEQSSGTSAIRTTKGTVLAEVYVFKTFGTDEGQSEEILLASIPLKCYEEADVK